MPRGKNAVDGRGFFFFFFNVRETRILANYKDGGCRGGATIKTERTINKILELLERIASDCSRGIFLE